MNKLKKIGLSALAGSLVAISANAVEVSISGGATMFMSKGAETTATGLSMSDSVTFTTSGTTNGGIDVSISLELDGDAANDVLDSKSIKFGTDDLGTVTFAGHGGSSVMGGMDDKTPNAYEEAWDAGTSVADDTLVGRSHNDSLRYDSPSFNGITVHAYHSEQADAGHGAYQDFGIVIKPEMVAGLELGFATGEYDATGARSIDQDTMYAKYAYGPVTVGYQLSESSTSDSDVTYNQAFESTAIGVTFAVNDDFSIGYGVFEADYTDSTKVDQESTAFTASYTMGSMTIGGLMGSDDNIAGTAANDNDKYEVSLSIAF